MTQNNLAYNYSIKPVLSLAVFLLFFSLRHCHFHVFSCLHLFLHLYATFFFICMLPFSSSNALIHSISAGTSPFQEGLIVVMDGMGETYKAMVEDIAGVEVSRKIKDMVKHVSEDRIELRCLNR